MSTIQPAAGPAPVHAAIRDAARATDTDFDYLLAQARVESALNPAARARTSSAAGLFQFTRATWLETLKAHGAEHGLGWAADAISTSGGRAHVVDPAMRQAIMDLRFDPAAASLMAGEFAGDNADYLGAAIGRAADNTELYLAHFLGAEGARRFITAHAADPSASAAALFPEAASANRGVFYAGGAPRSLGEVRGYFESKLGAAAGGGFVPGGGNFSPHPVAAPSPAPRRASMAEVLETALGITGGGAPAHVSRAYGQLARFGL